MKSSSRSLSVVRERWSPAASAVVVCALAIAVGSLFLTTYTENAWQEKVCDGTLMLKQA